MEKQVEAPVIVIKKGKFEIKTLKTNTLAINNLNNDENLRNNNLMYG